MTSAGIERAPAKVNLALHVVGRRADGYHLLDSLVAFAGIGDLVEAEPAVGLSLTLDGPFGRDLDAGPDNLVIRAAKVMRGASGRGAALRLTKVLPVASGIGGGSADAAATLRLLRREWGTEVPAAEAVLRLGADVPVCLDSRACRMSGIGERLDPVALPDFWMVLVNPGTQLATAAVFAGLLRRDNPALDEPGTLADPEALFRYLAAQRNDLETPAIAAAPVIAEVIAALASMPDCRLARMSGSGATCFGLFARETEAMTAAERLRRERPSWWVTATPGRNLDSSAR